MDKELLTAAHKAAATIASMYLWLDMVDAEGGATSIAGIAKCHAMVESMRKNRARMDELIIKPLNRAIERVESGDE